MKILAHIGTLSLLVGTVFLGWALLQPAKLHPQAIECRGMAGNSVVIHTEDVVKIEPHGFSSMGRNGIRYYFSPSLDMTCWTREEGQDI